MDHFSFVGMGPDSNRAVAARMGLKPIISGLTIRHLVHLDLRTMIEILKLVLSERLELSPPVCNTEALPLRSRE